MLRRVCVRYLTYLCFTLWYEYKRMHTHHLSDWRSIPELNGLADLPDPPKHLWYRGTWDARLFSDCIAVVGSRRMTEYGRRVIEKIIPQCVFEKRTVISGFMYGVDQYAHRVCIENGGRTVAVLGWGIRQPLEGEDKKLAEDIVSSGGLLMSEWEDQQPTLWTFPVRNRIVAALSEDVIVVEAAVKSGSLITAHIAKKLNRRLWAVPGQITNRLSSGTNALIDQGKARMWLGNTPQQMTVSGDPVLATLADEALSASELARKLGKPVADIGAHLTMLAVTGQVIERGGTYRVSEN